MRSRYLWISVLSLVVFFALSWVTLRAIDIRPPADAVIDTSQDRAVESGARSSEAPLRIAVSAMVSPRDTVESYAEFAGYLAKRLDRRSELVVRKSYEEVNAMLAAGEVDVAFICTGAYLLGSERDSMELLAAPVVRGQEQYYSDIIVARGSPASSLAELKGSRFAFVDELSNTGRDAPRQLLASRGEDADTFFSETIMTGSHDKSIRAVANGLTDGAAVDHLILEAMVLRGDEEALAVKAVERIGPYPMPPVVTRTSMSVEEREAVLEALLEAADDPEARRYLDVLGIDRFRVASPEEYQVVGADTVRSVILRDE